MPRRRLIPLLSRETRVIIEQVRLQHFWSIFCALPRLRKLNATILRIHSRGHALLVPVSVVYEVHAFTFLEIHWSMGISDAVSLFSFHGSFFLVEVSGQVHLNQETVKLNSNKNFRLTREAAYVGGGLESWIP